MSKPSLAYCDPDNMIPRRIAGEFYVNHIENLIELFVRAKARMETYENDYPEIKEQFRELVEPLDDLKKWIKENPQFELYDDYKLFDCYKYLIDNFFPENVDFVDLDMWIFHHRPEREATDMHFGVGEQFQRARDELGASKVGEHLDAYLENRKRMIEERRKNRKNKSEVK